MNETILELRTNPATWLMKKDQNKYYVFKNGELFSYHDKLGEALEVIFKHDKDTVYLSKSYSNFNLTHK